MNPTYKKILLGALTLAPLSNLAQTPLPVERGETITLQGPEGYDKYQWQVSSDLRSFVDLPDAHSQNLILTANAPGYYRVKSSMNTGNSTIPDTTQILFTQISYAGPATILSAAHGYVELRDGTPGASGINLPEEERKDGQALVTRKLTQWTSGDAMAVFYINHPQGVIDTKMKLTIRNQATVHFRISLWDPQHMQTPIAENHIALKGTGQPVTTDILGINIPRKDYYRYQIECLEGWQDIEEIDRFLIYSDQASPSYKAGWLSSPSVHLSNWRSSQANAPKGNAYDWCYQEVMMPKESDIIGTYVMSLGVLSGYMGIQMNGYDEEGNPKHEVLYSMWDDGSTDEDPNLPIYCQATVVDHDPQATVNRFGGEGTGMQTYYRGNHWDCDTYVQFLTNCRPETRTYTTTENGVTQTHTQQNMLVSTWFNAQDGKGWQYMSTLRLPNNNRYFDSWYSFLENYNWATGQAVRKGYYRNGYARSKDSREWYHFNTVDFGHTDGGNNPGNRNDYGQGASDTEAGAFFMTTGGYLPTEQKANQVPQNQMNTPIDTIDLARLEARIDEAIEKEKAQIEEEENFNENLIDKSNWSVIDKSSEETSGEGTNGRASLIIDGDNNTYWHSQWTGATANYPHHLTIDMKTEHLIDGFQITMSGGNNRFIKSYQLYGSFDQNHWELIFADEDAPESTTFREILPQSFQARYLKLKILEGRATDGPFVRINEFDVSGSQCPTGLIAKKETKEKPLMSYQQGNVSVVAPESSKHIRLSLYDLKGVLIQQKDFSGICKGQKVEIKNLAIENSAFIVSYQDDFKTYSVKMQTE